MATWSKVENIVSTWSRVEGRGEVEDRLRGRGSNVRIGFHRNEIYELLKQANWILDIKAVFVPDLSYQK